MNYGNLRCSRTTSRRLPLPASAYSPRLWSNAARRTTSADGPHNPGLAGAANLRGVGMSFFSAMWTIAWREWTGVIDNLECDAAPV